MNRLVLTAASTELEQHLRSALGAVNGALQVVDPSQLLAKLAADPPEVVILGPEVETAETLVVAAQVDAQFPWVSVVLVADSGTELWADAMRAGVREILAPDADPADVRLAVERASHAAAGRRHAIAPGAEPGPTGDGKGRVIAVVSPKGGTGKTTIATNLAVGLGAVAPLDTVLVDLDVQFGDVATALQMKPENSLAEAVHGPASTDTLVLKSYLSVHTAGFYAVCAPDSPAVGDTITGEQVSNLLQQLASEFRYVIVDTAPGLGEHALAAIEQATDAVMLCGMDAPSVLGLRKELAILGELDMIPGSRHVVLNFAGRHSGLSVRDVEATIGVPIDIVLPHSRAVPLSTNRGVPLLQESTRDPMTKGLRELVQRFDPTSKAARKNGRVHRGMVVR